MAWKYIYSESCFTSLEDPDAAYWLGFLFADGNINNTISINEKGSRNNFKVVLSVTDKDVLEKFKEYLGTDQLINIKNVGISKKTNIPYKKLYTIVICDQVICERLIKIGLTPRKTYNLTFPTNIPDYNIRHFIRGFFDGDGCISLLNGNVHRLKGNTNRLKFCLIGTFDMIFNIQKILIEKLNIGINKIVQHKCKAVWQLHITKKTDIENIRKFLYEESNTYMERKKQLFFTDIKYKLNETIKTTSKYKNVCFHKRTKSWRCIYRDNNEKRMSKCGFKTEDDAYAELLKLQSIFNSKKLNLY